MFYKRTKRVNCIDFWPVTRTFHVCVCVGGGGGCIPQEPCKCRRHMAFKRSGGMSPLKNFPQIAGNASNCQSYYHHHRGDSVSL